MSWFNTMALVCGYVMLGMIALSGVWVVIELVRTQTAHAKEEKLKEKHELDKLKNDNGALWSAMGELENRVCLLEEIRDHCCAEKQPD